MTERMRELLLKAREALASTRYEFSSDYQIGQSIVSEIDALIAPSGISEPMFVITYDWLHANSTPGGGWTAKQLRVIGIEWGRIGPPRGWLRQSVGKMITVQEKERFEQLYRERQQVIERNKGQQHSAPEGSAPRISIDVHIHDQQGRRR